MAVLTRRAGPAAGLCLALASTAAAAQLSPIPPVPAPSAFERELREERVEARVVVVAGVKALAPEVIDAAARPFTGRSLARAELRELERRLTQLYIDRGFATSGVIFAGADPDGTVRYQAIEGTLAQVRFREPPRHASAGWLTSLLVPRPDAPIRIPELQDRMGAIREAGIVERINAEVVPLPERGAAELVVSVEERRPWSVEVRYDNHHSPAVGARRPSLWLEHRNLTGWGDRFDGHVARTEGLDDFHVAYSAGLPRTPWRAGVRYERSDALAIDPPSFRDLLITTISDTRRGEVAYAPLASAGLSYAVTGAFERRTSESTLLGLPFSFIAGLPDGITNLDVARLSGELTALGTDAVLFLRGQWSEGRSKRPVESLPFAPDARFRALAAQAQYARRLTDAGAQVLVRLDGQYSGDSLFPIEKRGVGGSASVRGYRENVLLRDRAIVGTVEARWPLWKSGDDDTRVTFATFVDGAYARETEPRVEETVRSIASVGIGLAVSLPWGFSGRVDYARPNRRWLTDNADSQDRGLHFRVSWSPR